MKRVGELMAELGFREDAPESLKEALVAGLKKSLTPSELARLRTSEAKGAAPAPTPVVAGSSQLSFFDETPLLGPKDGGKETGNGVPARDVVFDLLRILTDL